MVDKKTFFESPAFEKANLCSVSDVKPDIFYFFYIVSRRKGLKIFPDRKKNVFFTKFD